MRVISVDRQRVLGECLNDMSFDELRGVEQEMEGAVDVIRKRKVVCVYLLVSSSLIIMIVVVIALALSTLVVVSLLLLF